MGVTGQGRLPISMNVPKLSVDCLVTETGTGTGAGGSVGRSCAAPSRKQQQKYRKSVKFWG